MTTESLMQLRPIGDAFRHEAFFYAGTDEFVDGTRSFILDGLAEGEAVLVVVDAPKIDLLRSALGPAAPTVEFADMAAVGRNPARIIPAWRQFVREHHAVGRNVRGIGEPIGPLRTTAELAECHLHESLLNVAFAADPPWWLLCPYDTTALAPDVVAEARRTHPFVTDCGEAIESDQFRAIDTTAPFDQPLAEPRSVPVELAFTERLEIMRATVRAHAEAAGLGRDRSEDLVLAVNELATNSLRHGGGHGKLLIWTEGDALVCEVRDGGRIVQPLVGRELPTSELPRGRGLWMVNQLCDLVQVHSSAVGTAIRVHMQGSHETTDVGLS